MTGHSPLPWMNDAIANDVFVRDAEGHYVMFGEDGDISGDDARFIVKAVNAHAALVFALREVAALTQRQQLPLTAQIHELVTDALSKAEATP